MGIVIRARPCVGIFAVSVVGIMGWGILVIVKMRAVFWWVGARYAGANVDVRSTAKLWGGSL